jgi:hypothetical protein
LLKLAGNNKLFEGDDMKKLLVVILTAAVLSGCLGQMGLSGKVKKFNMEATEDRWGREGLFLGLYIIPVYEIAALLDLLIFNSVEFWTGTNPINNKSPALVDMPMAMLERSGVENIASVDMQRDEKSQTVTMVIVSKDGLREELSSVSEGDNLNFYRGKQLMISVPAAEIEKFQQSLKTQIYMAQRQLAVKAA